MRRTPSIALLLTGGILHPLILVVLGLLFAVRDPETNSWKVVADVFPISVLLPAAITVTSLGIALILAATKLRPMRWWVALLISFSSFVLSVAVAYLLVEISEPLYGASQWPAGTLGVRVFGMQILVGLIVSGSIGILKRRPFRGQKVSGTS